MRCRNCLHDVDPAGRFCPRCRHLLHPERDLPPVQVHVFGRRARPAPAAGRPAPPGGGPMRVRETAGPRRSTRLWLVGGFAGIALLVLTVYLGAGGFAGYRQYRLAGDYARAEAAMRAGRWDEAVADLDRVIAVEAGYRNAREQRAFAVEQRELARLYGEGLAALAGFDYPTAAARFDAVLARAPGYPDAAARRAEAERGRRAAAAYDAALTALGAEQWDEAIAGLDEVLALVPNYRDARGRRDFAVRGRTLARAYSAALEATDEGRWDDALAAFARVLAIAPGYKDAAARRADLQARRAALAPFGFRLTNAQWYAEGFRAQELDLPNQLGETVGRLEVWVHQSWPDETEYSAKACVIGLRLVDVRADAARTVFLTARVPADLGPGSEDAERVLVRGEGGETLRAGGLTLVAHYEALVDNVRLPSGPADDLTFRRFTLTFLAGPDAT